MNEFMIVVQAAAICAICITGIRRALNVKSWSFFWWIGSLYFGILFSIKSFSPFTYIISWRNYSTFLSNSEIILLGWFVVIANTFYYLGESLALVKINSSTLFDNNNTSELANSRFSKVFIILGIIYFLAGITIARSYMVGSYLSTIFSINYEPGWLRVIFFLSSGVNAYWLVRKKVIYLLFSLGLASFIAWKSEIRSFLFPAVAPLLCFVYIKFVSIWKEPRLDKAKLRLRYKQIGKFVVLLLILYISLSLFFYKRGRSFILPESKLIDNFFLSAAITLSSGTIGLRSLSQHFGGYLAPFWNALGLSIPSWMSEPSFFENMAVLLWGSEAAKAIGHAPGLWYGDAFASLGLWGALLGFCWGFYLMILERKMRKSADSAALFSTVYLWIQYFILRGAIDNAALAVSYALWGQLAIYFILFQRTNLFLEIIRWARRRFRYNL